MTYKYGPIGVKNKNIHEKIKLYQENQVSTNFPKNAISNYHHVPGQKDLFSKGQVSLSCPRVFSPGSMVTFCGKKFRIYKVLKEK